MPSIMLAGRHRAGRVRRTTAIAAAALLPLVAGCLAMGGKVTSVKSPGVDLIPVEIGFYPLLSTTPFDDHRPWGAVKSLDTRASEKGIYIMPPAESDLALTRESQIMTGLLSTELSIHGFHLKELPVEQVSDPNADDKGFVLSLDLLHRLREGYNVKAVLVGNAFFVSTHRGGLSDQMSVASAHLKVIDSETLDVLGQVNMAYDADGVDMNDVAATMALSLAELAELAPVE